MSLLVIKVDDNYVRVLAEGYELVSIKKATVFSYSEEEKVLELYKSLKQELEDVTIKRLIITEEDYFSE
jgi:hypothetical protein